MTDDDLSLDDDRSRYFVRTYRTEEGRTLVWVPELDLTMEGDWRWVNDVEAAAIPAIAAKLQVPIASFAVDVDCPIDMDPDISPEFKAELERRAAEHDACLHDWRQVSEQDTADGVVIKTLTAKGPCARAPIRLCEPAGGRGGSRRNLRPGGGEGAASRSDYDRRQGGRGGAQVQLRRGRRLRDVLRVPVSYRNLATGVKQPGHLQADRPWRGARV